MIVLGNEGNERGRLLWRLIEAVPAHTSQQITPSVREQIIGDLKIKAAFEKALAKAGEIQTTVAPESDLETTARKADLETFATDMLTRMVVFSPAQEEFRRLQNDRIYEAYVARLLGKPIDFYWTPVPNIDLPSDEFREYFIHQVFKLTPENVEPPYPEKSEAVVIVSVPVNRSVYIIQRIGYRPPVTSEYVQKERIEIIRILAEIDRWKSRVFWFNKNSIIQRVGFERGKR